MGGPALGGLLVATFGPHAAALFDAGTYLLSAVFVAALVLPTREVVAERLENARHAVAQILHEMAEGVRVVASRPLLRIVFLSIGILFLSQGIINPLLVVLINQIWGVGAQEFGWIISAQGVGGIIGTLVVGALAAKVSPRAMIIGGGTVAGAMFLAMVNQPSPYAAIGLMVILGIAIVAFDVGLTTLLQLGSDDANRGRVSSLMQTTMAASQLVAIAFTTLLADRLGAIALLNVAGILFLLGGQVAVLVPKGIGPGEKNAGGAENAATPQPAE